MQWIFAHPADAKQLAENCHAIVTDKFNLEDQLLRLVEYNNLKAQPG